MTGVKKSLLFKLIRPSFPAILESEEIKNKPIRTERSNTMEGTYNINDLALMTGFTTRTLRTYLKEGLLKGEKVNGIWQFSAEEIDRFFREPFVKEGLRIKRSGQVFDFMADQPKAARSCVILDIPASVAKGNQISAFFCSEMCL